MLWQLLMCEIQWNSIRITNNWISFARAGLSVPGAYPLYPWEVERGIPPPLVFRDKVGAKLLEQMWFGAKQLGMLGMRSETNGWSITNSYGGIKKCRTSKAGSLRFCAPLLVQVLRQICSCWPELHTIPICVKVRKREKFCSRYHLISPAWRGWSFTQKWQQ